MKLSYKVSFIACFSIISSFLAIAKSEAKPININDKPNNYFSFDTEKIEKTSAAKVDIVHATCDELGSASLSIDPDCIASATIEWSTGDNGIAITDLEPGEYSVIITYNDPLCGDVETIVFIVEQSQEFFIEIDKFGLLCSETGFVTLTTMPYGKDIDQGAVTYEWNTDPPDNNQAISVNEEGAYQVIATLGNCADTAEVVLSNSDFFEIVTKSYLCPGKPGSIAVDIINPELAGLDFTYVWSTGEISPGINVTNPGIYSVTVASLEHDCISEKSFDVEFAPEIELEVRAKDVSCYGLSDGRAVAFGSGGMRGGISYNWSTRTVGREIANVPKGEYYVTATDKVSGCTTTKTIEIKQPDLLEFKLTPEENQGLCFGESVVLTATVKGGKYPYEYTWKDGVGGNVPVVSVDPTETTTYEVVVTDANGCTTTPQKTTITVSPKIKLDINKTDLSCHGKCTGTATINTTGGIEPFNYSWNSPTNTIGGLCGGKYFVTVTDKYECFDTISFVIDEPDTLSMTIYSNDVTCFGGTDGKIKLDMKGGAGGYTYTWNTSSNTGNAVDVPAGYHTVTITDARGCKIIETIQIKQPEKLYVTSPKSGTICIGSSFFTEVNATGGKGPYAFEWTGTDGSSWYGSSINVNPTQTTTYALKVTDSNGCIGDNKEVLVKVNPEISISEIKSDDIEVCLGESILLDMDISGGDNGPYRIVLNNKNVVNLPYRYTPSRSGYVKFTISDGCTTPPVSDSLYIRVNQLPEAAFIADRTAICPFEDIQFYEINPEIGQTYQWEFGDGTASSHRNPIHMYRTPGLYDVKITVTSAEGCVRSYISERMIDVYQNPIADFEMSPNYISIIDSEATFVNLTKHGSSYYWDFGDGTTSLWSESSNIAHKYANAGTYPVMLIAKNKRECIDTIQKNILIHDMFTFYAPTAFTPNNDSSNDIFYVIGTGIQKENFSLKIFDKFGMLLFETDVYDEENPRNMGWDGTAYGDASVGDVPVANGVYIWRCLFVDLAGKPHEKTGQVTLIR